MLLKTIFFTSTFLLCGSIASSQNGGTNWTFGLGCGLHFEPDGTVTQFQSGVYSREGVATSSDPATGDLLFYTDGTQVWDANHSVMPNGYGLLGDYSSTQSAVIVPKPGDSLRYYVFTAPVLNVYGSYYYSVVNMAANNGLGEVEIATKNTLLLQNGTEKIGLARHCNGRDFWLILREASGNTFRIYLIDKNGVQPPQQFSLGANLIESTWNETGYLRMSSDETMLAHPIGHDLSGNSSAVELFGFDNATGTLSGPIVTLTDFGFAYGAEFSADSKLLYVSDIVGLATSFPSAVYQYDVSSGNAQTIANSKVQLITASNYAYGALQLAPNGKIYVAKENGYDNGSFYLDVIESPSVAGSGCNYVLNGLALTQGMALIGLPHADYRPYQPPTTEVVIPLCHDVPFYIDDVAYTAPDTVTDYGTGDVCALPIVYQLVEVPDFPTAIALACPADISVTVAPGDTSAIVTYSLPNGATTCPCSDVVALSLQQGLPSGHFPLGPTKVCYEGRDSCGNTRRCCFNVTVEETVAYEVVAQPIENALRLFPNPTEGTLFADLSAWAGQTVQWRVFSAQGLLLRSAQWVAGPAAQLVELPAVWPAGLYSLEVTTARGERKIGKFTIVR